MNDVDNQIRSGGLHWQFSLRAILVVVAICAASFALWTYARNRAYGLVDINTISPIPFRQAKWQNDPSLRLAMAKDIIAQGILTGLTRTEVRSLLGIGDMGVIAGDDSESYELHDNVITAPSGEAGIGEARLHVWFDAQDTVREVRIELHGYAL